MAERSNSTEPMKAAGKVIEDVDIVASASRVSTEKAKMVGGLKLAAKHLTMTVAVMEGSNSMSRFKITNYCYYEGCNSIAEHQCRAILCFCLR